MNLSNFNQLRIKRRIKSNIAFPFLSHHLSKPVVTKRVSFILFFLTLLLCSCRKEDSATESLESKTFSISQAKSFFQKNASDLRRVSLGNKNVNDIKSIDYNDIVVPDWEEALYVVNERIETYEIPIKNTGYLTGIFLEKDENGNITRSSELPIKSKLIIQKSRLVDTIRQFVVTISGLENNTHNVKTSPFDYYGNRNFFNGYMIISDLEGHPTTIFYYKRGKRQEIKIHFADNVNKMEKGTSGFGLLSASASTKSTYGNGELGVCSKCGMQGIVYITYGLCLECVMIELDDIIVNPKEDQYCPDCNHYPCKCLSVLPCGCFVGQCTCNDNPFSCHLCGRYNCSGECDNSHIGGDGGDIGGGENMGQAIFMYDTNSQTVIAPKIDLIMQDCAGASLINNIRNISFINDPSANFTLAYSKNTNTIKWKGSSIADNDILHELVHALQAQNGNTLAGNINIEVEAFMAYFAYSWEKSYLLSGPNDTLKWIVFEDYIKEPSAETYQILVNFVRDYNSVYSNLIDDPLRRNFNNIINSFDCYPISLKPVNY